LPFRSGDSWQSQKSFFVVITITASLSPLGNGGNFLLAFPAVKDKIRYLSVSLPVI
jgi:hypothetical protein